MTPLTRPATAGALIVALILWAAPVHAQQIGDIRTDGTSYRVFARPGENTIQVFVLGDLGQPGVYSVGADTELAQLVALTGGPGGGGRSDTTIRLYRPENGRRELIYEAELDDFIRRSDVHPDLQSGDILQVETIQREGFDWRDGLRILTAAASLSFAIERLFFE
jgi:hypothetical protein